ncbi:ANKRD17, partial [Symbiodinium sp. CCMP2456]
ASVSKESEAFDALLPLPGLFMLRVWQISGVELAAIPAEELSDVLALKQHLRVRKGLPVCLQELLHDGIRLQDSNKLGAPMDVQLVLLSLAKGLEAAQELREAATKGEIEVVRLLLRASTDKDSTN